MIPEIETRSDMPALRIIIQGQVQGVGFRPFVYRLAVGLGLKGEVRNCVGEVEVLAQGQQQALDDFLLGLVRQAPQIAKPVIQSVEPIPVQDWPSFRISASEDQAEASIHVPVDYFICDDCLRELSAPANRRHAYPFINCTQCGPRYTLIAALPYDRPNTSMASFNLCPECLAEYQNPLDRRFHAEPIACPSCGPHLWMSDGTQGDQACLQAAIHKLRQGRILAVKGVGGYHLMCDARSNQAVDLLRQRKHRPHKPLAVMLPSPVDDPLGYARQLVHLDSQTEQRLCAPDRPIILVRQREGQTGICAEVAPGLQEIGIMLPYSPLHHLLLNAYGAPLVATSGNLSGEPVLTDPSEAEAQLSCIAELFLHHDRPILRPADDSVLRPMQGAMQVIRLGRGLAPAEFELSSELMQPVLALGGHMKNTVALAWGKRLVLSPHIGDMGSLRSQQVLAQVVDDLQRLYRVRARMLLCDAHPGYGTSLWAERQGLPVHRVWHHHAHASALLVDQSVDEDVLVFTWDGTGLGEDGSLWGGEALVGRPGHWRRFASIRPFRLPGGDKAGHAPWRSAAGCCWEAGLECPLPPANAMLHAAWAQGLNAPQTSAIGRLFDAVAALLGVCVEASFDGQAPMMLEAVASNATQGLHPELHPLAIKGQGIWRYDWQPLLLWVMQDAASVANKSQAFHQWLAQMMLDVAQRARGELGIRRIGFGGGVFQNRLLSELAGQLLSAQGFDCLQNAVVPMNDAGLSLGQVREFLALSQHA